MILFVQCSHFSVRIRNQIQNESEKFMKYQKEDMTKSFYENISYNFLKREDIGAVLISGENFKGFTQKFQKPYDSLFLTAMSKTLVYLCSKVPGCIFGYTSRYDMVVFFAAPDSFEIPSWFNYDTTKISTHVASMATLQFNRIFEKTAKSYVMSGDNFDETRKFTAMQGYVAAIDDGAVFTAKCFNIQKNRIHDYIYLLQMQTLDSAARAVASLYFSNDELVSKSVSDIELMIFEKSGIKLETYPAGFRLGSSCVNKDDKWIIEKDS